MLHFTLSILVSTGCTHTLVRGVSYSFPFALMDARGSLVFPWLLETYAVAESLLVDICQYAVFTV